jgi:predicted HicB family RNase H-like nuclease
MKSENINDLINQVKSKNEQNIIQKIVPIPNKEIEEIQFSFYIEKELYKKLKLKAINQEMSMKEIVNEALRKFI